MYKKIMSWRKKWGRDKICGITQARLRPGYNKAGESYTLMLTCGHRYYRKGILKWIEEENTCPVCRNNI